MSGLKIILLISIALVASAGISLAASIADLTGDFRYVGGPERDDVEIYITVRAETGGKLSLALVAAHPDGHGAAPDGNGEGQIDSNGVLRFTYEDSFFNKGTGTFRRTKNGYGLSIQINDVQESRCLAFYGDHTLQRESGKSPRRDQTTQ